MPFTDEDQHFTSLRLAAESNARVNPIEMWPPYSPDLNPVDYSDLGVFQEWVYRGSGAVEAVGPLYHCGSDCAVAYIV